MNNSLRLAALEVHLFLLASTSRDVGLSLLPVRDTRALVAREDNRSKILLFTVEYSPASCQAAACVCVHGAAGKRETELTSSNDETFRDNLFDE